MTSRCFYFKTCALTSLFRPNDLLHERLETRIAAQVVEERISWQEEQVAFVTSRIGMFERFKGAFFFTQRGVNESGRICTPFSWHVHALAK